MKTTAIAAQYRRIIDMSVFEKQSKSHMDSLMFFDGGVDIARYDQVQNPALEKITEKIIEYVVTI